jgi:hypothetical protein
MNAVDCPYAFSYGCLVGAIDGNGNLRPFEVSWN